MTTRVIELDLGRPLPNVGPCRPGEGVFAVLRLGGQPVGLLRLRARAGWVRAEDWQAALRAWRRQPAVRAALAGLAAEARPASAAPISIVVCTHERPTDLARCLAALRSLAAEGHEVIVVDNAPASGRTAAVAAGAGFAVTYLVEPRPGLDRARNRGWQAARHAVVAFTDDDAVPDPGWAAAIAAAFASPTIAGVAGLVLPLELESVAQEQFEAYCAHRRTFARQVFSAAGAAGTRQLAPAAAGVVGLGANLAFRREWLERLGGFDPRLDGGTPTLSGGDTDLLARALAAGGHLAYVPAALVWHRHRRELPALRQCLFGYGVGLTAFLTKRLWEARDWHALLVGARWVAGPPLKAVARRVRGQPAVPLSLALRETLGAFAGPLRFWRAHRALHRETRQAASRVDKQTQPRPEVAA